MSEQIPGTILSPEAAMLRLIREPAAGDRTALLQARELFLLWFVGLPAGEEIAAARALKQRLRGVAVPLNPWLPHFLAMLEQMETPAMPARRGLRRRMVRSAARMDVRQ